VKDIKTKALEVIESVCVNLLTDEKEITIDSKVLGDLYSYAHIAIGRCETPHLDWKRELNIRYEELKRLGEI